MIRPERFVISVALLTILVLLSGCGHSASETARYAETIFWEEDEDWGGFDSVSDTEMPAEEDESAADSSAAAGSDSSVVAPVSGTVPDSTPPAPLRHRGAGRIPLRHIGHLREVFNDSNHFQLVHARKLGITPINDLGSYYHSSRPLVKIETNPHYKVDELKHSYPYLVPEAARLLDDIGRGFQDSLQARGAGNYRIIVTSVLRTPVTVKKLRRVNVNATSESTHQYATTFDITYTRFDPLDDRDINDYGDLKNLLAEVLHDLRLRGRCMVKFERKTPCFHITVVQ